MKAFCAIMALGVSLFAWAFWFLLAPMIRGEEPDHFSLMAFVMFRGFAIVIGLFAVFGWYLTFTV